jgi:hypothetical protein
MSYKETKEYKEIFDNIKSDNDRTKMMLASK